MNFKKNLYKDNEELLIKNDKLSYENRKLKYSKRLLESQNENLRKVECSLKGEVEQKDSIIKEQNFDVPFTNNLS